MKVLTEGNYGARGVARPRGEGEHGWTEAVAATREKTRVSRDGGGC